MRPPLVSIVTPFHNTVEYLEECIQSVLNQTYQNFEYILVNNASTDGSVEIAHSYAAADGRIRYVDTETLLPQVDNYNYSMTLVSDKSRYTKMCQADDWIFPHCVEEMVEVAEASPSIAIVSAYSSYGSDIRLTGLDMSERVLPGREICRRYFLNDLSLFGSPTSLLYRSSLVRSRSPFFRPDRTNPDTDLCFEVLLDADFGFVHQVMSYLRPHTGSVSNQVANLLGFELVHVVRVEQYGKHCLSESEWNDLRRAAWSAYYRQLGAHLLRSVVRGSSRDVWRFHRAGLESAGHVLSTRRVVGGATRAIGRVALSPLQWPTAVHRIRR